MSEEPETYQTETPPSKLTCVAEHITEVTKQIDVLTQQLNSLRLEASNLTEDLGGKAQAAGLIFTLTEETTRVSYAARDVDALVARYACEFPAIARDIASLRSISIVKPTLRITKVKQPY